MTARSGDLAIPRVHGRIATVRSNPFPRKEFISMYQIGAFIALFIAFVSLVLLTQVPPVDDQPAVATTTWGQSAAAAASERSDLGFGEFLSPVRAGR